MQEQEYVGKPVTSLQTMLRVIAREDPSVPTVIPSGVYGADTQKAVSAFQRSHALPVTGSVDHDTWRAVCRAYRAANVELSPAEPLDVVMHAHKPLLPGSDNRNLLLVQAMLHNLHEIYGELPDCDLSGVCDESTQRAIRALQSVCGLEQTGIVDKALWQLLCGLYTQAVGDGEKSG